MIESKYTPEQIADTLQSIGMPRNSGVDTIIAEARRLHEAMELVQDHVFGRGQPRQPVNRLLQEINGLRASARPRLTPTPAQIGQAIDQWQAARAASDRAYALQAMPPAGIEREEIEILIRHYVAEEKRLAEAAVETLNR